MIPTLSIEGRVPCQDAPQLFGAPDDERKGSRAHNRRIAAARALCYRCPVIRECREAGRKGLASGIWGAEDDKQREKAGAKPRDPGSRFQQPPCGTARGAQWHRRHGGGTPCTPCLKAETIAARERKDAQKRAKAASNARRT